MNAYSVDCLSLVNRKIQSECHIVDKVITFLFDYFHLQRWKSNEQAKVTYMLPECCNLS